MRYAGLIVAGALIAIAGAVFALQGFGYIGGSFMSGSSAWAIIGPILVLAGLVLAAAGLRRLRSSRAPAA